MPTRRQERVAKRVTQELVDAFRQLKHVKLGFVTITKCEVSPDLRHAKVLISVLGEDEERMGNLEALHRNASKLRHMIGRPLGLKMTPELHFELDDSLATADRISRLIRDARATDANPNPLTPEEEAALLGTKAAPDDARQPETAEDVFEQARREVEDELLDDEDDDPDWKPLDINSLPEE